MAQQTVSVTIGTVPFRCTVCGSGLFWKRDVKLTSGRELFAWANTPATGLMCAQCGYLHLFFNPNLRLHRQEPSE